MGMTNVELEGIWMTTATTMNEPNDDLWTLRVVVDGVQLVENAVKRLDAIGVTMQPNGAPLEYAVQFPPPVAGEVIRILVDQGASLCPDQTWQLVP